MVGSGGREVDSCATGRLPFAVCRGGAEYGLGAKRRRKHRADLRRDELSPGIGVAALYRLGRTGPVSRRTAAGRLPNVDGEREPDASTGSRRCDGVAERRFLCAVWPKHEPSALVERDGDYADAARAVWNQRGC